jgi:uncharacterized membrane protein
MASIQPDIHFIYTSPFLFLISSHFARSFLILINFIVWDLMLLRFEIIQRKKAKKGKKKNRDRERTAKNNFFFLVVAFFDLTMAQRTFIKEIY